MSFDAYAGVTPRKDYNTGARTLIHADFVRMTPNDGSEPCKLLMIEMGRGSPWITLNMQGAKSFHAWLGDELRQHGELAP